jgi:hypothetical protein
MHAVMVGIVSTDDKAFGVGHQSDKNLNSIHYFSYFCFDVENICETMIEQ